jgi:hypothetical protein
MRALIEQYPPLLGFSIELFQNVIKRFKGGKELDGIFTKALGQIGEIARAKEEAAKQPPPPDPVMQEMQARMQIAQVEAQARMSATQMQMQDAHEKNMLVAQESQLKMQRDQLDAQLAINKQQFEQYIKQAELGIAQQEAQIKANAVQVDLLKVQSSTDAGNAKLSVQQEANRMAAILDIQSQQLEQTRIQLSETEKLMEERRLAAEQEIERMRLGLEAMKPMAQQSQQQQPQPVIVANVVPPRS